MRATRLTAVTLAFAVSAAVSACSSTPDWQFGDRRVTGVEDSLATIESAWLGSVSQQGAAVPLNGRCYLQVVDGTHILDSVVCGPVTLPGRPTDTWQTHRLDLVETGGDAGYLLLTQDTGGQVATFDTGTAPRAGARLMRPDGQGPPDEMVAALRSASAPSADVTESLTTVTPKAGPPTEPTDTASPIVIDPIDAEARASCPPVRDIRPTSTGWLRDFSCTVSLTSSTRLPALEASRLPALQVTAKDGMRYVRLSIEARERTRHGSVASATAYEPSYFAFGTRLTVGGRDYEPLTLRVEQAEGGGPGRVTAVFEVPTGRTRMAVHGFVSTRLEARGTRPPPAPEAGAFTYSVDRTLTLQPVPR